MKSQKIIFGDDLLISGTISVILSPIVIILISVIADEWPDGDAGIGPSFFFFWGFFATIGTVIFFIISSFTNEGIAVILRGHKDKKNDAMLQSSYQTLPPSDLPFDVILEEKTQESYSDENVLESEKAPEVEESSMGELEKLIERRNAGEMTSEDFEEAKKKILERKPQYNKELGDVQEEVHSDDMIEEEIKDSIVSKSNVASGGKSKSEELREAKALLDDGIINEDDYEKMKREIIG